MPIKLHHICEACSHLITKKPIVIKGHYFHRKLSCLIKYRKVKREYHKRYLEYMRDISE